jgi:hypothetical protein
MPLIQLKHYKKLAYSNSKKLPYLPNEIAELANQKTVISFRPTKQKSEIRTGIHACTRFTDLPAGDVVFYGLESDSPLAPLILWDVVHFLPVGNTITLLGEFSETYYLEREYYQASLEIVKKSHGEIVFRKIKPLLAEQDSGLDCWTFGIPVGPGDATLLNVVVKRILELDVPEKEILLCGKPGNNFKYWDKVRIVGEDITAPPVQISKKKNRLADEASHNNICIIHDRVFLPLDFFQAIKKYGDRFPFLGFQSLYFDDLLNFVPRRYSDFGRLILPNINIMAHGFERNDDTPTLSPFAPSVFDVLEDSGFMYANPLRYNSQLSYLTGSLYLVKRSVWKFCQQNEGLHWIEFEDVEQGLRASEKGIPSRINPNSLTQSLISRLLLNFAGNVEVEHKNGKLYPIREVTNLLPIQKKPAVKFSTIEAQLRLKKFADKYISNDIDSIIQLSLTRKPSQYTRLKQITKIVYASTIPFSETGIARFILDYEKLVLLDQLPYSRRRYILEQLTEYQAKGKSSIIQESMELLNYSAQRPFGKLFYDRLDDYLPKRSLFLKLGTVVSALLLAKRNSNVIFNPEGFKGHLRAILNSTPYKDYAEKD